MTPTEPASTPMGLLDIVIAVGLGIVDLAGGDLGRADDRQSTAGVRSDRHRRGGSGFSLHGLWGRDHHACRQPVGAGPAQALPRGDGSVARTLIDGLRAAGTSETLDARRSDSSVVSDNWSSSGTRRRSPRGRRTANIAGAGRRNGAMTPSTPTAIKPAINSTYHVGLGPLALATATAEGSLHVVRVGFLVFRRLTQASEC